MAYPSRLEDQDNRPIGSIIHKAGVTLVQVAVRAIAKTTGSDPVGWMAVATHVDGEDATHSDSGTREVVLIASVDASADARAVSSANPLPVTSTSAARTYNDVAVGTVGTAQATIPPATNQRTLRVRNHHQTNGLYYRFTTGVTTSNSYLIEPGQQEEFEDFNGTLYIISDNSGTEYRYWSTSA